MINPEQNLQTTEDEAVSGFSPEDIAAIGLFLISSRRESLGANGALRYQPIKDNDEHQDHDSY